MNDTPKGQIIYLPPDRKLIEQFSQKVGRQLGHDGQADTEMIDGLTEFLTEVAALSAKVLTNKKTDWLEGKFCKHRSETKEEVAHAKEIA